MSDGAIPARLPENETQRLAELDSYGILDTLSEQAYDDATALAAQICDTPIALITLVDRDRQRFKSHVGLDVSQTPRAMAFCSYAILDPAHPTIVPDASNDERFRNNPLVIGDPRIRFYAGGPLVTQSGNAMGTLCIINRVYSDARRLLLTDPN